MENFVRISLSEDDCWEYLDIMKEVIEGCSVLSPYERLEEIREILEDLDKGVIYKRL